MRTLRLSLAGTLTLTMLGGASLAAAAQPDEDPSPTGQGDRGGSASAESLLFTGASYVTWNGGVETHVAALAASEDPPRTIVVDTYVKGLPLWDDPARYATATGVGDGDHDVVILDPAIDLDDEGTPEPFYESARVLDELIRDAGGRMALYMWWPHLPEDRLGHDLIEAAHRHVEAELGVSVAPVGMAMIDSLMEQPGLDMLGPDLDHPTIHGTYLAAAVIYATVFDRSPEGLSYRPDGVSDEDAAYLQGIAWDAVQAWREGAMSPAPDEGAWVTGTISCSVEYSGQPARVTFHDGIWRVSGLPLLCSERASDARVSGSATNLWNCDCQFGVGSPTWGAYELRSPEGSWVGTYRGTRAVDGSGHSFAVLEGTDAYEGLTYMVDWTHGKDGTTDSEGVIYEGEPPSMP